MKPMGMWTLVLVGVMATGFVVGCGGGDTDGKGVPTVSSSDIKTIEDFMVAACKTKVTDADVKKVIKVFEELQEIEGSEKLMEPADPNKIDFGAWTKGLEDNAKIKAVFDKHGLSAREYLFKFGASVLAMTKLDPDAKKMKEGIAELEKNIAETKAKADATDMEKQMLPMMEKTLKMQKAMFKGMEGLPQETVDAVKPNLEALKKAMK